MRRRYDFSRARPTPYVKTDRRTFFRALANLPAFKEMLVLKRRGSVHEERIVDGRARCNVCGWLDEADPLTREVRQWHADTATGGGP